MSTHLCHFSFIIIIIIHLSWCNEDRVDLVVTFCGFFFMSVVDLFLNVILLSCSLNASVWFIFIY